MSETASDREARSRFFVAAIVMPTLRRLNRGHTTPSSCLAAIDAADWLNMARSIGYLEGDTIPELKDLDWVVSLATKWLFQYGWSRPDVPSPIWSFRTEMDAARHHSHYQNMLLLTSEYMLHFPSFYFLESVGWVDDDVWRERITGAPSTESVRGGNSVASLSLGFANVISYLDELESAAERAVRSADFADLELRRNLYQWPRRLSSWRANFGTERSFGRVFELANRIVDSTREDTPSWLDARRALLLQARDLLRPFAQDSSVFDELFKTKTGISRSEQNPEPARGDFLEA